MKRLTTEEALQSFPLVAQVGDRDLEGWEIFLADFDDAFRGRTLVEDESQALGHGHKHSRLYVVRSDHLSEVSVRRTTRVIYPPEYLHPGMDFPSDEWGNSETVFEALAREGLSGVQYVLLHEYGTDEGWVGRDTRPSTFNRIVIASL